MCYSRTSMQRHSSHSMSYTNNNNSNNTRHCNGTWPSQSYHEFSRWLVADDDGNDLTITAAAAHDFDSNRCSVCWRNKSFVRVALRNITWIYCDEWEVEQYECKFQSLICEWVSSGWWWSLCETSEKKHFLSRSRSVARNSRDFILSSPWRPFVRLWRFFFPLNKILLFRRSEFSTVYYSTPPPSLGWCVFSGRRSWIPTKNRNLLWIFTNCNKKRRAFNWIGRTTVNKDNSGHARERASKHICLWIIAAATCEHISCNSIHISDTKVTNGHT